MQKILFLAGTKHYIAGGFGHNESHLNNCNFDVTVSETNKKKSSSLMEYSSGTYMSLVSFSTLLIQDCIVSKGEV